MTPANTPDQEFDADAFLNSTVAGAPMSTSLTVCPEGTYRAQIGEGLQVRPVATKTGTRTVLRLPWQILDDAVIAELKRDPVVVNQDLWLDFDETGQLDSSEGKNVDLGRVREAVGQNTGDAWSPGMLRGQQATVRVGHRSDRDNPERKYDEIRRVVAISS